MSNKLIDQMVNRFLGWKLPADFSPDCGISFKRESDYEHPEFGRNKYEPVGTNLLTADQARQMIEHLLGDMIKDAEPAAFGVLEEDGQFSTWDFICGWPEAAHEHINEQIVEWKESGEEPPKYSVVKLYTDPLKAAA